MSAKIAVTIADDVRDVLARSTMDAQSVLLPDEKLDQKLYERVNKVLEAAGGRWSRSAKMHVFSVDPRQALQVSPGVVRDEVVDIKKKNQAYYTPAPLARRMVELARLPPHARVLEPSAGHGVIAREVQYHMLSRSERSYISCVELDPKSAQVLRNAGHCLEEGDFLECDPPNVGYDAVIMNPPFANSQDVKHVRHALRFVRPGGRLVAILTPGFVHRRGAAYDNLRAELARHEVLLQEDLPEDTFLEAGTRVRTVLLVVEIRA